MALKPNNEAHALQIQAGILGRKSGHEFEDRVTAFINSAIYPISFDRDITHHVNVGEPALLILNYIASIYGQKRIEHAVALSTGALATSEDGKKWLEINGVTVKRCKSDLIVTVKLLDAHSPVTVGVSTKQCNNATPTNAQLYFTTARGFCSLMQENGIPVSDLGILALRQFCGDKGYQPLDDISAMSGRVCDPRRYFWEEINSTGRAELENILALNQDAITRLLLQKAYLDDPFAPDLLIHKTKKSSSWENTEVAIYTIDEIITHSRNYGGFSLKPYSVRKGSYKDPVGVTHLAPRFGIVQMQRGGQAQHPEQLQFNLEAGYFYKISQYRPDVIGNAGSE